LVTGNASPHQNTNTIGEQLLLRLSAALAREAEPEVVVRAAVDALVGEVGAVSSAVFFADLDAGVSRPIYAVNYPDDVLEQIREVPLDVPAFSNIAIKSREVVVIPSRDRVPSGASFSRALAERMGVGSAAAVPLLAGGQVLGVVVYCLAESHEFSDHEIRMLREVGDRIAAALERARLLQQLARRAEEAELLHSIATAAAGEDDLNRILTAALDRLSSLLHFTGGSIALVEGNELVIRAAAGTFAATALGQSLPRGKGRTWQIVESGEPFLSHDLLTAGYRSQSHEGDTFIRSYLAVPLIWRGRPFGILEVDALEPNVFRQTDVALMQSVAALLSGPIELARRLAAEVQLRHDLDQARGRLEAILEHAPLGIFFFDTDFNFAYANRSALDMVLPSDELRIGRAWDELEQLLAKTRWAGSPAEMREIIVATRELRDGILVHDFPLREPDRMLLRVAAPVWESGRFSGHVILMLDVTSERLARDEAERSVAVRDRFISIASHELKTPLTSIKGMAQLALRAIASGRADQQRLERSVRMIDFQADRLRQLIEELLDVSRIQSGRMALHPEATDLVALVGNAVESLDEAGRARVQVTASGPAPGQWDPLRLEQVISNLLENALKYSAASEAVEVSVALDGDTAVLRVTDRGIGVPLADQRGLFEPFARAANAAGHDESGLGLGLFITRQIVEGHRGSISLTSRVGEGSTFTVRLPIG
jgi:signal transduction histidine kinase